MTLPSLSPEAFLRDGGVLTMDEWVQLSDAEKVAFRKAQRVIRNELADEVADRVFTMFQSLGANLEDQGLTEAVEKALAAGEDDG